MRILPIVVIAALVLATLYLLLRYRLRVLFHYRRLRLHFFGVVSIHAKCPACGCRKDHKIVWVAPMKLVLHQCSVCQAPWGHAPVVDAEVWSAPVDLAEERERAAQPRGPFGGAQRDPIYPQASKPSVN